MKNKIYISALFAALFSFMFCEFGFAQNYSADYYNVNSGTGKGLRLWGGNNNYKIHMGATSVYKYGPVTSYSIKTNMSNHSNRGWTWGIFNKVPVAALNTQGNFQIKGWLKSEGTLISTSPNSARYVYGNYGIIHRNDGGNYWMLLTGSGNQYGGWNTLRPFRINNATGNVHVGNNTLNVVHNGNVGIGTLNPAYKFHVAGDIFSTWVRTAGATGLYFQSYGGGFRMTDATWIRTFGNKSFYHNTGIMRTDGTFQVGPNGNRLRVDTNGNVGINTTTPNNKLDVNGTIRAKEIKVESGWSDYVFYNDYQLPTLEEEEKHIEENGHLLGFESEQDMEGMIHLGDVSRRQQAKIEEIMLHLIDMKKEMTQLREENEELKKRLGHK